MCLRISRKLIIDNECLVRIIYNLTFCIKCPYKKHNPESDYSKQYYRNYHLKSTLFAGLRAHYGNSRLKVSFRISKKILRGLLNACVHFPTNMSTISWSPHQHFHHLLVHRDVQQYPVPFQCQFHLNVICWHGAFCT